MSEALILYRGRGGVDPESLKPTTITSNGNYVAPVTGNYMVYTVGGGGGGGGGCRNSWNSSQVFYGAGGSRGALNTKTVFLNAGDQVPVTLGAGGSGGVNNTTVVSNNSRGTNGGSGGTTSFGSYASAAGGSYGAYSWSYTSWINTVLENRYYMSSRGDNYRYLADLGQTTRGLSVWYCSLSTPPSYNDVVMVMTIIQDSKINKDSYIPYYKTPYNILEPGGMKLYNFANSDTSSLQYYGTMRLQEICNRESATPLSSGKWRYMWYVANNYSDAIAKCSMFGRWTSASMRFLGEAGIDPSNKHHMFEFGNITSYYAVPILWNNYSSLQSTRCYTSIQQGSWWYQNNNQVSTSGTRTYRGDGGVSGQTGNAGFILVIPPQS